MSTAASYPSVLDALQWANPPVEWDRKGPEQPARMREDYTPFKVRKWTEFTFENLTAVDNGRLFQVAASTDFPRSEYPAVSGNTETTENAIYTTSWEILTDALNAVKGTLPTCSWRREFHDSCKGDNHLREKFHSEDPKARHREEPNDSCLGDLHGGAIVHCAKHNDACRLGRTELLPKVYGPPYWTGKDVVDLMLEGDGRWKGGYALSKLAQPIRQAYTCCVLRGCRFGCIITLKEAFVFRIRPCTVAEGGKAWEGDTLEEYMHHYGMLEYQTYEWTSGIRGDAEGLKRGDGSGSRAMLTMNLALWSLHVLATSDHRMKWKYDALSEERLGPQPTCITRW